MLHTLKILALALAAHRTPVTNPASNHYLVAGHDVQTVNCTVTTTPGMTARVEIAHSRAWLALVDSDGQAESDACEIAAVKVGK